MYILSKEESDRIRIIKFISIILVVYLHSYSVEVHFSDGTSVFELPVWLQLFERGLSQIAAGCSVQIFFLISSVLFFRTDQTYGAVIRKKIKTLLLPYLIWNSFWIIVFAVLQSMPFTSVYFSGNNTPVLQCSLREWLGLYGIGQNYPQCYPLWFMRDLMVMFMIYPVIKAGVKRFPEVMFASSIILMVIPVSFYGKIALEWFILGAVLVKEQIHITALDYIPLSGLFSVYLLGAAAALFLDIAVVKNIFILIGVLFWIRLSKTIYSNEKLRSIFLWLSKWIFIIYVFHELTLSSVRKICQRLLPVTPLILCAEYLMIPILVITGCIIAGMVLKRIMPGLYTVLTGER